MFSTTYSLGDNQLSQLDPFSSSLHSTWSGNGLAVLPSQLGTVCTVGRCLERGYIGVPNRKEGIQQAGTH